MNHEINCKMYRGSVITDVDDSTAGVSYWTADIGTDKNMDADCHSLLVSLCSMVYVEGDRQVVWNPVLK